MISFCYRGQSRLYNIKPLVCLVHGASFYLSLFLDLNTKLYKSFAYLRKKHSLSTFWIIQIFMQLSNYEFGEHLKSSIYLVYTTACLGFQQIYLSKNLLTPYFLACCWHSRIFACLSFQQKICLCSNIWAIQPFGHSMFYWVVSTDSYQLQVHVMQDAVAFLSS